MLGNNRGSQRNGYVSDYVLFDLETTGTSCYYDEIIEISAVKVRNGRIIDEFSELVNPGRKISYAASMVNNITDDMVKDALPFKEILPDFIDFIGDDVLAGHNIITFDLKFLYRDCEKYFGQQLTNDFVDTLRMAKMVFPDWKHRRLSDLAEYYGISTAGAHRALADCKMNQKVFELLGKELSGAGTLGVKSAVKLCTDCGMPMKKRTGKYGEFWGCTGYPRCRHTENISDTLPWR